MSEQKIPPSSLDKGAKAHELAATVALIRTRVVPQHKLSAYLDRYGSAVKLVQLSEDDRLMTVEENAHEVIGAVTPEGLASAMVEVEEWERRSLQVVSVLEADYPENLRGVFNRPPLLFIEGEWKDQVDRRSIAVVGTRSCSERGVRRAQEISRELVAADFTVLSGMAVGIDTAAHKTALEEDGRTVAVMGTGLDHRYPKENRKLSERIVESGGALVTQFLPAQGPRQWTFPMRNVTMSGLSLATVVIEASSTSGAKMQARVALQHGRTVFLLDSLVAEHEWAQKYVNEGKYETEAIAFSSMDDILERIDGSIPIEAALAV